MTNITQDIDTLFEGVYNKLLNPEFGKNLGGELPIFIQPFHPGLQGEIPTQINRLMNRLSKVGKTSVNINLYDICLDILRQENLLNPILEGEKDIDSDAIISTFDGVLDVQTAVLPLIQGRIEETNPDFVFITGVGSVYPFVRSHTILNNIDELALKNNLLLFFPGEYDRLHLKLFGKISDETYYRGQNLDDLKD
ncbi:DUF1788 domain-containing protein [Prevotella brunnea]|uniref:DUF1788 domain-containing protein n=1 Tax=Prevotella brunnea TaxID=2508867 RepID=A0A5C8GAZ7_9BACT|nr:DUF1788 domain-containing protein [Prevotella brunnea]MDR0185436.1 DUF1788 domain-containing protein [Prevotella brunnea]TXJ59162.1 DUF1788 domain-containing protein [Prevotella brunnea]